MRIPRKRFLRITVNGTDSYTEPAGNRVAIEVQHHLATEIFPGAFVRVSELYLGGAKAKEVEEDDEQEG